MFKRRSLALYARPFILLFICLVLFLLASPAPVAAYIPTGYQEYYVVGYEEHLWRMYVAINDNPTDPDLILGRICSTVSLVATARYQVIYYDHWEDGYEPDLFNPVQASTEVYGDGNTGNGGTGTDVLVPGDDLSLTSTLSDTTKNGYVPVNPARDPAQIRYDGGDRILSTGGPVALAHAVWPHNGTWVGDAFEIYSRQAQQGAYDYHLPIGEDLYPYGGGDTGSYGDFRNAYLQLQAFEDNTTVLVDNGVQTVNMTLNRGQTYSSMGYVDSNSYAGLTINSGTRVHSNKPTQALLITGADGTYQGRSFTVLSDRLWGSDYVVPVPSAYSPYDNPYYWTFYPAEVYLSNPNDFPITVHAYDRFAQTTFTIPPTGNISATVPYSSKRGGNVPPQTAARFTSPDGVFGVFIAASTSDSTYDWGASGMPSRYLTRDYYASWAPGSDDIPPVNNGSPLWVTPLENDTIFFVDHNDTAGGLDGIIDETFELDVLEQRRVFDDDNDNTGMHIWASGDFAVLWGEDPRYANIADPYLDIGLTVLPAQREWLEPILAIEKTADPTVLPYSGGTVTFTLVTQAINALMSDVDVTDTLPANWSYVASSALVQYPDGSSASQEPLISGQTLAWDLSYNLDMDRNLTITFQAQTSTAGSYDNTAYDGFESNSYTGGSGWAGDWTEVNESDGAGAGQVQVLGSENGVTPSEGSYQLRVWDDNRAIDRVVDLSSFSTPLLRFMRNYNLDAGSFYLELSTDRITWTKVYTWGNSSGNERLWVEEIVDLTSYKSATTYVRFRSTGSTVMDTGDWLYVDQVELYEGGQLNVNRAEATGVDLYSGALFNPTDQAVVYISPIELTKAVDRGQAAIGDVLVYTLDYQNTSATSSVTHVTLRDSVPTRYVTFLSATGGGTFDAASGTLNWSLGTLTPGASGSVSFQVQVNSFGSSGEVIKNVGRIDGDGVVEARSNEVSTLLLGAPEIEVIKDGPTVAYSGERITYTLSYENTGGASATNVVISDTIPVSATYVPGSLEINTGSGWGTRAYDWDGSTLVIQPGATPGTVEAGETGMIRFSVDLDSGLGGGELVMNWAVYDRDLDHARDTNLVVTRISDLLIAKSAQQASVAPDGLITYTLSYRNTGAVAHDDIVLREPVPDYTQFVWATPSSGDRTLQYSGDNGLSWSSTPPANVTHIRWLDGSLAAGGEETVTLVVRVNSTLLPNTTIRNIATISSTLVMAIVHEPIPSNEVEVPTVDLWVAKSVAQSSAAAGAAISYTVFYGNRGSADVPGVQILDTLPAGASYVPGSIWGTGADAGGAPDLAWNVGTVAAGGGTQQVGYAVRLDPSLNPGSQVVNTADISSLHGLETSLPVTTTVATAADLRVSKADLIDPVQAGRTLTYTIAYTNAGPSDARNVTIVDTMPASATFDSVVSTTPTLADPTPSGSTLTWSPGTVAAGSSGTIVFSVLVNGLAPASLINNVSIASSTSEYAPGDESDSETTAVTRTVSFQSASYSVSESAGTASINVALSSASPTPVSVRYATSNGTAAAPADYTASSGTVNFPANTQVVAFTVPIVNDALDEANETVNLSLSAPAGVALASPTAAVLTITDNDPQPTVRFSAATYSANEGVSMATITVTLNTPSGRTVTVDYATSDGTAAAGLDYTTASGTLTFNAGVTSRSFTVPILDDARDEPDETVSLTLSGATNATLSTPNPAVLKIEDNDAATLSINDASVDEGPGSTTTGLVFTVSLSIPSAYVVTVNYSTRDGTAYANSDYVAANGTLIFDPGVTSLPITITIWGDGHPGENEIFYVDLSGAGDATIADGEGVGTILNDDSARLEIGDVTVTEGDSGSVNAIFEVTLSRSGEVAVTVDYTTSNGSATAPADYTFASGSLTFAPGVTSRGITVAVQSDLLDENDEVYYVNLSNSVNATIADYQGLGTIVDDDPTPTVSFSAAAHSASEGAGLATVTVNLNAASGLTVTVDYATSDGTAIAGVDYTASTGTLTFVPGVTSQSFSVPILDDASDEDDETVSLALSGATNATPGTPNPAQLTIVDDDATPTLSFDAATYSVNEGPVTTTVVVNLSAVSDLTVTVSYAASDGTATAGADYTASAGTLVFPPGVTSQSFEVPILEDARDENDETVTLTLSGATNATLGTPNPAVLTIVDDDATPRASLSSAGYTVNEGGGSLTISVTLSAASGLAVSLDYATSDSTAIAGSDYTAASGTLSFDPGVTLRTFSVPIADDNRDELNETFSLALSNPVNVTLGTPNAATATILDDDASPSLRIGDVTVTEGDSGSINATFGVTLSALSNLDVTVAYNTVDDTTVAGQDYTAVNGTLTFPAGSRTRQVIVPVLGDVLDEIDESYYVALSSPTNATVADNLGLGTIVDDDAPPQVSLSSSTYSVDEGVGMAAITATLDAPSGRTVYVNYATSDGTALAGLDYAAVSGTLSFAPGIVSVFFSVPITDDALYEGDEWLGVSLSNSVNASLGPDAAALIVLSNDNPPAVDLDQVSYVVLEDVGLATITVTLDAVSAVTASVDYATSDGTAIAPVDYTASSGRLSFSPGVTRLTFSVPIADENTDEQDETLWISLTNPVDATLGPNTPAVLTIVDDDGVPGVRFAAASYTVSETHSSAVITVSLSNVATSTVTVSYATGDGTASAGADYTAVSGTLTFDPGVVRQSFEVPVLDDARDENDETVHLVLSDPVDAYLSTPSQATLTILDDDDLPVLNVSSEAQTVGENAGFVTVTLQLDHDSSMAIQAPFSLAGAAISGTDYTLSPSPIVIPPGELSAAILVTVTDDALDENDEGIVISMGDPVHATRGVSDTHTLTILDDDEQPAVRFSSAAQSVSEGAGTVAVNVQLDAPSGRNVWVPFALSGTAVTGDDYTINVSSLLIPAGSASADILVSLVDDALYELPKTIVVTLDINPTNAVRGEPYVHTLTLVDDDASNVPILSFASEGQSQWEDVGSFNVAVSLSYAAGVGVSVPYTVSGTAADGGDFTIASDNPLVIPAGSLSANIVVSVVDDTLYEYPETIVVTLGSPTNATLGEPTVHTATLNDDDSGNAPTLSFSSGSQAISEDGGTLRVAAWLDRLSGRDVIVYYSLGGSATPGVDYIGTSSPVLIRAGKMAVTITITVGDDAFDETDETIVIALGYPDEAYRGTPYVHTITITDNDGLPSVAFTTASQSGLEGSQVTVTAQLNALSGLDVQVPFTLSGTASSGDDYDVGASPLVIPAGSLSAHIAVSLVADDLYEDDETIIVTMDAPVNAVAGTIDSTSVNILDGDGEPGVHLSTSKLSVDESAGIAVVQVSLATASSFTATVDYAASDGTATAGSDYIAKSGTLTFTPGSLQQSFEIRILQDWMDEADETVLLTLSNPVSASLSSPSQAALTIVGNVPHSITRVYLPMVMRGYPPAGPDLVVESIVATGSWVQVVVRNKGNAPVTSGFWVDLYADPNPVPVAVNQTWNDGRSSQGIVWAVVGPAAMQALVPGGGITLTNRSDDPYYWPPDSRWTGLPAGKPMYAQVDSANEQTGYGAVREVHEMIGGKYNNILGPVYSTLATGLETVDPAGGQASPDGAPSRDDMPPRP